MILPVLVTTIYSVILFIHWHQCIIHAEFGTPLDIVRMWIKGESLTAVERKVNLRTVFKRMLEMCRYKYIFKFLY